MHVAVGYVVVLCILCSRALCSAVGVCIVSSAIKFFTVG